MEYLISRDGQRHGPYSVEVIRQLRAEGRILDTDLCWAEGMPGWTLVTNAFDLPVDEPAQALPGQEARAEDGAAQATAATAPGPAAPMPPSLHWTIVLALSALTLGLFGWAWMFIQAAWVRRIDSGSRAMPLLIGGLFTALFGGYVAGLAGAGNEQERALVELLGTLAAGLFVTPRRVRHARLDPAALHTPGTDQRLDQRRDDVPVHVHLPAVPPHPDRRGETATDLRSLRSLPPRAEFRDRDARALVGSPSDVIASPVGGPTEQMKQTEKNDVWQGTLAIMVLSTLEAMGPQHGYGIARRIDQISEDLLSVNHGTLYPVLLRLEQEGAIEAEWGVSENNRKARFYRLTKAGKKALAAQKRQWDQATAIVARFFALEGNQK